LKEDLNFSAGSTAKGHFCEWGLGWKASFAPVLGDLCHMSKKSSLMQQATILLSDMEKDASTFEVASRPSVACCGQFGQRQRFSLFCCRSSFCHGHNWQVCSM